MRKHLKSKTQKNTIQKTENLQFITFYICSRTKKNVFGLEQMEEDYAYIMNKRTFLSQ